MAKKLSLKERLKKQKEDMKNRSGGGNVLYLKEGTTRIRIMPITDDELGYEVTHFYLNEKLKGIYSAATFDEDCYAMETYHDLKNSKDEDDLELAKKLTPKSAYLIPVVVYEDEKGKKIDKDKSGKLMKVPGGVYQQIIDLYLDEDEWGDMTDPKKGYDIKIIRTGKGKNNTEYSVMACKNTPLDKEYAKKGVNLEKMVRGLLEPYDTVKEKIDEFIGEGPDDDDDKPSKKKKSGKKDDDFSSGKKKKKKVEDDDEDDEPKKKKKSSSSKKPLKKKKK